MIRLPGSGAILFLIRTYMLSLRELAAVPAWGARFAAVLRELPQDMVDYKGLTAVPDGGSRARLQAASEMNDSWRTSALADRHRALGSRARGLERDGNRLDVRGAARRCARGDPDPSRADGRLRPEEGPLRRTRTRRRSCSGP